MVHLLRVRTAVCRVLPTVVRLLRGKIRKIPGKIERLEFLEESELSELSEFRTFSNFLETLEIFQTSRERASRLSQRQHGGRLPNRSRAPLARLPPPDSRKIRIFEFIIILRNFEHFRNFTDCSNLARAITAPLPRTARRTPAQQQPRATGAPLPRPPPPQPPGPPVPRAAVERGLPVDACPPCPPPP